MRNWLGPRAPRAGPGTAVERWRLVTLRPPTAGDRRALARQAIRDSAVRVALSPWRLLRAVTRDGVHAAREWRRWVRVGDYREAAEQADKLADKYLEIRELSLFRWRITTAVLAAGGAGGTAVVVVDGPRYLWALAAVTALMLAWAGRRKEGAPGRRPVLAGPRSLTWTMDPQVLVDAFRDAKLIGKDETLRLVERAHRQGKGWAITVDLPATARPPTSSRAATHSHPRSPSTRSS